MRAILDCVRSAVWDRWVGHLRRHRAGRAGVFSLSVLASIPLSLSAVSAHVAVIAPYSLAEIFALFAAIGFFVAGGFGLWLEWLDARSAYGAHGESEATRRVLAAVNTSPVGGFGDPARIARRLLTRMIRS